MYTLNQFIVVEKPKSSTEILTKMIDEWEHLFAKDINLILIKCFMIFIQSQGKQNYKFSCNGFFF